MNASCRYPRIMLPEDFDARRAYETPLRGYLSPVIVETSELNRYEVFVIDPIRLQQELDNNIRLGEPCFAEPAMIVVPTVTIETIQSAVDWLYEEGFFNRFKPL